MFAFGLPDPHSLHTRLRFSSVSGQAHSISQLGPGPYSLANAELSPARTLPAVLEGFRTPGLSAVPVPVIATNRDYPVLCNDFHPLPQAPAPRRSLLGVDSGYVGTS
jgi:hypothetical protein